MSLIKPYVHPSLFVLLLSSAYVAYGALCKSLRVDLALTGIGGFSSLALILLNPGESFAGLRAALRRGNGRAALFMALHGTCTVLWLFLVLWTIGRTSSVNALFVLLLQPILQTQVGIWIGDQVGNKRLFVMGVLLAGVGAFLVKTPTATAGDVLSWHTEDLYLMIAVGLAVLAHYLRTELTRNQGVSPHVAVLSGQLLVLAVGGLSAGLLVDDWASAFTTKQVAGLAYLGVVPTAIAGVGMQRCFNLYGWPQVTALEMFKPLWGLLLTLVVVWINSEPRPEIFLRQGLGLALTLAGCFAAFALGRPSGPATRVPQQVDA